MAAERERWRKEEEETVRAGRAELEALARLHYDEKAHSLDLAIRRIERQHRILANVNVQLYQLRRRFPEMIGPAESTRSLVDNVMNSQKLAIKDLSAAEASQREAIRAELRLEMDAQHRCEMAEIRHRLEATERARKMLEGLLRTVESERATTEEEEETTTTKRKAANSSKSTTGSDRLHHPEP